jgi:eukaryotic-like serine/threonine-protein kinase
MGSVWVAHHLTLDTEVAVKFMSAELGSNAQAAARFEREAKAAARIKSPHVVRIFDHGISAAGVPFITMELLSGEDLGSIIKRRGALAPDFVRAVVIQAARGLTAAHKVGTVHRDIKPENVFISDEDGEPFVRLLDFGIAKQAAEGDHGLTGSRDMLGTPYTMSPEQVMSTRAVDPRSDLWSLAVVAYRALTTRWPFEGEGLGQLLVNINAGRFRPATALQPGLPATVDAWFSRALAHQPEARFPSAREMAEAFSLALGYPGSLQRSSPPVLDVGEATRSVLPDTMAAAASARSLWRTRPGRLAWIVLGASVLATTVGLAAWWKSARPAHVTSAVSAVLPPVTSAAPPPPTSPGSAPAATAVPPEARAPAATPDEPPGSVPAPSAPVIDVAESKRPSPAPSRVKGGASWSRPGRTVAAVQGAKGSQPSPDATGPSAPPTRKDRGF